jgi:anti-sigma B factor antagonist
MRSPLLVIHREEAFVVYNTSLWTGGKVNTPRPRGPGDQESLSAQFFDIDVTRQPDQPVIAHVIGSIDLLTAPALRLCVEDNVIDDHGMVLDLSEVDFLAASGLTVLTDTEERASREHLAWALVVNTRPVLRPLDLLGLRGQLPTFSSVRTAVAAVASAVTSCR